MQKLTTKQFTERAKSIHGDLYDYSKVDYVNGYTNIIIVCSEHGDFNQRGQNHLSGQGCPKCGKIKSGKTKTFSAEKFIEKANKVHNNKYNYDKVNYTHSKTKVKIICNKHGNFEQVPNEHLKGYGCAKCRADITSSYMKENSLGWSYTDWKKVAEKSNRFDSFKVYIIRCWNNNEEFYKIGKTFTIVNRRFACKRDLPYNYEVLKIIKGEAREICELERQLQKENNQYTYTPKIDFRGMYECFSQLNKETYDD